MKLSKTWLWASAAAAAALAAAPASAQRVDRIVAFGDSYADDGNLFELLGIARPPVYGNGRFSNGTNFVDTMAQLLGVPVDNFAIGGAFTGNGNINGPGIPGFVTEYQSFLAGGGPAAGEEGLIFGDEAGNSGAVDVAVAGEGAADREIVDRNAEQLSHGVDEIGAVREAAIAIDRWPGNAEQLEEIAVVRIGIAESDDSVDPLRRSRSRSQSSGGGRRRPKPGFRKLHSHPPPISEHRCQ